MSVGQPVEAASSPDLALRSAPPSPKRLSRKVVLAGVILAFGVIAFAVLNGLARSPSRPHELAETAQTASSGPPDTIRLAQSDYGAHDLARGNVFPDNAYEDELAPPEGPLWSSHEPQRQAASEHPALDENAGAIDPEAAARSSAILFDVGGVSARATQDRDDNEMRLDARLLPPRSRYELQAGHVIPAALVTALNSDLPGQIIAQVTAPVYDSITGEHLLIPQGARLIGVYRSGPAYGESRLFLSWTRLILPNGWSISLRDMTGSDAEGAAGVRDRTDHHLDRLAVAVGLSAVISVIANNAEDEGSSSLAQSVGDAAAQQAAQTGGRIVDRELSLRPTIRVRAGAPVRVLVMRDIELRPYRGPTR